jgi:COP9 signalosome complex subunit 6
MKSTNQIPRSQNNLKVLVHPLIIMNCADHCNRSKYIEPRQTRVIGVLLGKQEGRVLDLINSIELKFINTNGVLSIDEAFAARRLAAYKTMFPNLDCLGWYTTGSGQKSDAPDE